MLRDLSTHHQRLFMEYLSEPMKEDHPLNNTNFYGATKVASEQIIRSYYHRNFKKFEYVV